MLAAAVLLIVWPCVWGAVRAYIEYATDKHYTTTWLPVLLLRPRIVAGLAASEGRGRVGIEKQGLLQILNQNGNRTHVQVHTRKTNQHQRM